MTRQPLKESLLSLCRREGDLRLLRLTAAGAASVVLALGTAACSDGHDTAATKRTTTTSTVSTTKPASEEVLAGYRQFWDAYVAAADPMEPEHPGLRAHATGEELRQVSSAFLAYRSAGEVLRGSIDLAPKVVSVDGNAAAVSDCYFSHILRYDARTGEAKGSARPNRVLVKVAMQLEGGTWKVASIVHQADSCVAAS